MKKLLQNIAHRLGYHFHKWPSQHHLSVDYPVETRPRWGYGKPPHRQIAALLNERRAEYRRTLAEIVARAEILRSIPNEATDTMPGWCNQWLPPLDGAALMHFILDLKPKHYLEIGSGTSTKFVRHAIQSEGLATKITSIDPYPRAAINDLCDEVIRKPLEAVDLAIFDRLEPSDILFFDGSHRVFMNSDVTVFFLEVLPRIQAGVLVQVHDIFWPNDYMPTWGGRYYSEQYMLGQLIIHRKIETVLPNAFIGGDAELSNLIAPALPPHSRPGGGSFWFQKQN